MSKRFRLPDGPPDSEVYPAEVVCDAPAVVQVDRLRIWPNGLAVDLTIEAPQPRRDPSIHQLFRQLRIVVCADAARRRGRRQPKLATIQKRSLTRIHLLGFGDEQSQSSSTSTVWGSFWLPEPLMSDAVTVELTWPAEAVSGERFRLELGRWAAESPQTPPDTE